MIEDYVSFEIAKLFKGKGFDINTLMVYSQNGNFMPDGAIEDTYQVFYAAPTLQMAMKWLREVHNIFIQVELYSKYDNYCFELFQNTHRLMIEHREVYNSYEETAESAIKYCLEKLI